MFPGRSASPGVAIGRALILNDAPLDIQKTKTEDHELEIGRLKSALTRSHADIEQIAERAQNSMGPEEAAIFEAHLMIIDDPELYEQTQSLIRQESCNAEFAFQKVAQNFVAQFESMDSEYMRARASDVRDIAKRVLTYLTGGDPFAMAKLNEDVILIAQDLAPSVLANLDLHHVKGFITEAGGRTSHVAIMARTLEIPAVVGVRDATRNLREGDVIVFDGDVGEVFCNPSTEVLKKYQSLKNHFEFLKKELTQYIGQDSVTLDGRRVTLAANIGSPSDIVSLKSNDAEGVGLMRTEFLYMNRNSLPTEEEQYAAYKSVLEACPNHTVVIRTLDIGGDKKLPYFKMEAEENPFLGNRAIRLCLKNKEIFEVQLRAILRASPFGQLAIMFPMISSLEELQEAKSLLSEVEEKLRSNGTPVADSYQVGIMIEVPSAALISDTLAQHCDFFSIGTNDLIQYTCAVDRMNKDLESLYSPYHPAVLRLIQMVIDNGHKYGIWVGVCGEVGGKADLVPLLLGMGLDEFSMSPPSILPIRKLVRSLNYAKLKGEVSSILNMPSATAVEAHLLEHNNGCIVEGDSGHPKQH